MTKSSGAFCDHENDQPFATESWADVENIPPTKELIMENSSKTQAEKAKSLTDHSQPVNSGNLHHHDEIGSWSEVENIPSTNFKELIDGDVFLTLYNQNQMQEKAISLMKWIALALAETAWMLLLQKRTEQRQQ